MINVLYIVFILLLLSFMGFANYIHAKRTADKYVDSYRWYVKILK